MRNIIITGGELYNKGAQAMTFISVDEMKKRFPDHNIILLSDMDMQRSDDEKKLYAFDFMGWYPLKFAKCQSNSALRFICNLRNRAALSEAENIYKNTDLMIDISGYALGSNWGTEYINSYLDHLEFADAFHIPMYLMPQSFGPFEFSGEEGKRVYQRAEKLLPTVKRIFAREQDGYDALVSNFHLNNVSLAGDIVLNNRGIDKNNIYKVPRSSILPDIAAHSCAVIPNNRNLMTGNSERVMSLYVTAISEMLKDGSSVYILSHSAQDASVCKELKRRFPDNDSVVLLEEEFLCIEFGDLITHFDYVVASRFHAIVHSFKSATPCIVLGWAEKYHELMRLFDQEQYMLDVRDEITDKTISSIVNRMKKLYQSERSTILNKLSGLQTKNVFDLVQI